MVLIEYHSSSVAVKSEISPYAVFPPNRISVLSSRPAFVGTLGLVTLFQHSGTTGARTQRKLAFLASLNGLSPVPSLYDISDYGYDGDTHENMK